MSVQKINGFAAPYRSQTFRKEINAVTFRNGVLSMNGSIQIDGMNLVLPPFVFTQGGLIVEKTDSHSVAIPTTLQPPYFATVHSPSPSNVDDLVYQYSKMLTDDVVAVAKFDGNEWLPVDLISVDGLIKDSHNNNLALSLNGPKSGLTTAIVGSLYVNSLGTIIDNAGSTVQFQKDVNFNIPQQDAEWGRVDRVIYRRPLDIERIGVRKLLVGGTYSDGSKQSHNTILANGSKVNPNIKICVGEDNTVFVLRAEGFGNEYDLVLTRYSSDRSTVILSDTIVATASSKDFGFAVDGFNKIHIAYILNGDLNYVILNSLGVASYGPSQIELLTTASSCPVVVCDNDRVYVNFINNTDLYLTTRTLNGSLVTNPVQITNITGDINSHDFCVDPDKNLYVVFEANGSVYYFTMSDIGDDITGLSILSNSTNSTSFGILSGGASLPKVRITDNKELVVAFIQKKNISTSGIAIYKNGQAYLSNLIAQTENFTSFDFVVDDLKNDIHILATQSNIRTDYILVEGYSSIMVESIALTGASSTSLIRDKLGSLVHAYTFPLSTTFTDVGPQQPITNIGPIAIGGALKVIVLANDEFMMNATVNMPRVGQRVTVTDLIDGSVKMITSVRVDSLNSTNDVVIVKCDSSFVAAEPGSTALMQLANTDGNIARFVKTVSELSLDRALSTVCMQSDILLSRIVDGITILNYVIPSQVGVNSDLFGMYGDIDVDWGSTQEGALTMTNGLRLIDLVNNIKYEVSGGIFPIGENEAMFVVLDGITKQISPQVAPVNQLPWSLPIQVLGFNENNEFHPHLFSVAGMGQLDIGESIVLGQDLSKTLRIRLGITGESTYQQYASTKVISQSDNYPTSFSKIDAVLDGILKDVAKEELFTVVDEEGQDIFEVAGFEFVDNNQIPDIVVHVQNRKAFMDRNGGSDLDYKKLDTKRIQFSYKVPKGTLVSIRDERTGGGGGGNAQVDLTNINSEVSPISNGAFSLGTAQKAWKSIFLKDEVDNRIYKLRINNGVFAVVAV